MSSWTTQQGLGLASKAAALVFVLSTSVSELRNASSAVLEPSSRWGTGHCCEFRVPSGAGVAHARALLLFLIRCSCVALLFEKAYACCVAGLGAGSPFRIPELQKECFLTYIHEAELFQS